MGARQNLVSALDPRPKLPPPAGAYTPATFSPTPCLATADEGYSLCTLRRPRSPLVLNAERGLLRVNRL